jgi:FeS assembly SUF system regulator
MLRLSKLTDYGTVLLAWLARQPDALHSAADVAAGTRLAEPTVRKLLKRLARAGLVTSQRGAHGGYSLARAPDSIHAVEIIDALEGRVALTECSGDHSRCDLESRCGVGPNWQAINHAVRTALEQVTLAELARPPRAGSTAPLRFHPRRTPREPTP